MILQVLQEYYDRKVADQTSEMAPPGFEWKEIPFVVVLQQTGEPVALLETYEGEGRDRRAKRFLVPQAVKKTSGIAANFFWDNAEYALGLVKKSKSDRVRVQHANFVNKINQLDDFEDAGVNAVRKFLAIEEKEAVLRKFDCFEHLQESVANVSFSLVGEKGLIVERPAVRQAIERLGEVDLSEPMALCLVSGERQYIERLHTSIKGVRGAQSSGANIVSFNLDAFESYGKKQGANAPVGKKAAFAYTTALNYLLGRDSRQRIVLSDTTIVFWAEKAVDLEANMRDIFDESPKDDPARGARAVASLYRSIETGVLGDQSLQTKFYVLGLAPNASRIAIRFWEVNTVSALAEKLVQHFSDLRIVRRPREQEVLSLFRLLVSTAAQDKAENIPPNLAGETLRSILSGLPYPQTLLQALVRRIRADHEISYPRASLIKAILNRDARFKGLSKLEELQMSLDVTNSNIGYRLGRLFSVLEKIQAEANPGINATIRDRFYGAASSTPIAVFSNLMRLKVHHLNKLEHQGRRIYFEKLIAEVMEGIEDFPFHLSLADQGRFAIGYYHQTHQFYSKREPEVSNL